MYPHLTSVIFKSEGAEGFGVCSTAAWRPFPNVSSGANGAKTATAADFDRNDLREVEFAIFGVLMLPGSILQESLNLFLGNRKLINMIVKPL